jgi:hypothetical protein
MSKYEYVDGDGDTITCDNCNNLFAPMIITLSVRPVFLWRYWYE